MKIRIYNTALRSALAIFMIAIVLTQTAQSEQTTKSLQEQAPEQLTIIVMDPLAAPLSCPCVEGYAQRDYQQLADFISQRTGLSHKLVFSESLAKALREKTEGQASLVIGKDSVVRFDAKRSGLKLDAVARLTGKDGQTTQTGLIIVRTSDPAQKLADLTGYRFLFGPEDCSEKYSAARKLLTDAGVTLPSTVETSAACSDGACKIIEWGDDVRAATVISSYAKPLLEGCGTISKGDLRVLAETEPVPFVTAFVNQQLPSELQQKLQQALLAVRADSELRAALETLLGFVPIPEKEKQAPDSQAQEVKEKAIGATSYTPPAIPANDSWPGWRGRHRDGHAGWLPGSLPEKLNVVWQQPLAGPGLAGVAANDRYVVIGDRDLLDQSDVFRCFDADNGKQLWTINYIAPGRLDYGNTPRATPLIDGNRVFLHGAFGHLHCVALESGEILWQKNFALDFGSKGDLPWGTCGSPLLVDGKLIVNPGAPLASVVALDPQTGSTLWQAPGAESAYGSFVAGRLGSVMQVVGHDAQALGGWDVATGKKLWTLIPENQEDFSVPTPLIVNGKLLVTTENNGTRLYGFDDQGQIQPTPLATNDDLASDIGTPVAVGDKLFAVWGELFCLDISNGLKTLWRTRDPSFRHYGSLIASGERMLISAASGELLLLDTSAKDYKVVSRLSVFDTPSAELYSHAALVGSRLYFRGEDALVCVELHDAPASVN